tara:strand:- start:72013 stop:72984 length:972 start_codon:yes stop_codon:yes gene_type:complete
METVDYFPIDVKQTSWQNSRELLTDIRHKVFVEEQHVPLSEEIDEDDPQAIHWLAYGPDDKAMATGRLLSNGQIGRMAVLKEFRDRGVGSALMRNIIRYANRENMKQLHLNSQSKAVPFYEGFGFVEQGESLMDAGILHKYMLLNLHDEQDKLPLVALPEITKDERKRMSIDGIDAFLDQAEILIKRAHREIRIFSYRLEPALYSTDQLCDAIYAFATSHPLARVNILAKDIKSVINHPNKLHELCQRLPSRISIKKFQSREQCLHSEFLIVDRSGILYKQEPERFVGYVTQYAPMEASALKDEFDELWHQGKVDPELKRLHI